ncbi:MAG: hypothetical protein KA297_27200 [Kofleriaceae bacterium]|nr:hypothetical protein [Kofleriaceae bacterium]MBP6836894.1 hypothetical protein [Kofleriaceae bacterium]
MPRDGLADRCKRFELIEADRRAMPGIPLLARLDGRAFHTFTRGLRRPFDPGLSTAMIETTRTLVDDTVAAVGYTQSDEITLAWFAPSGGATDSSYLFDGRFQKLASVLAGLASARFAQLVAEHLPSKLGTTPHFDCRVWQVPTLADAAEVFVWREDDASKNSITMAAGAYYDDAILEGKSSADKHELLFARGVNWNDYPAFFKRGTYLQRRGYDRTLTAEEREAIPERHRPPIGAVVRRHRVEALDLPPVRRLTNLVEVLFERADPMPSGAAAEPDEPATAPP